MWVIALSLALKPSNRVWENWYVTQIWTGNLAEDYETSILVLGKFVTCTLEASVKRVYSCTALNGFSQRMPERIESKCQVFIPSAPSFSKLVEKSVTYDRKYGRDSVSFRYGAPEIINREWEKSVMIRTSGSTTNENISRKKTDLTIRNLVAPEHFVIVMLEKAWIEELLMYVWYEKIWKRFTHQKQI